MPKGLKILAVISSLSMLFVLIGGALVTKTESGQGCGRSWPLCNGELVPTNITPELIIELSHRLVSGLAAFIVLALAIWSWKKIGHIKETKFLAVSSVLFLVLQALIGAGAVIWGQSSVIMALHFGISLISFSTVFLLTLLIFEVDKKFDTENLLITKRIQKEVIALSVYCYVVVYTGALVRHKEATLACLDFPVCNNNDIGLPNTVYEWVHMGHRVAAIAFFIWLAVFTMKVLKHHRAQKVLTISVVTSFILICLQVISGIATIYSFAYLAFTLSHALFISCLFGVFSYLLLLVYRSRRKISDSETEVA